MKHYKLLVIFTAFLLTTGCASTSNNPETANASTNKNSSTANAKPESRIEGNFPANSPFAKIKIGMTQGQVHEVLGQPTDTKTYQTGKAWIPFYFGPDVMRTDEFYKGVGIVTYVGAGISGVHWTVFRAIYNASEDGIPND